MTKDISLCGVELCVGAPTDGTNLAYNSIIKSLNFDYSNSTIINSKNIRNNETVRNKDCVISVCRQLYDTTINTIQSNQFPIIIGGDHSISIGSISASSSIYNECIFYIDAHTDINDDKHSPSGYIHGMPLASILGLCSQDITMESKKVNPNNIFIIGARSIDDPEWKNIKKVGINVYTAEEYHKRGWKQILFDIRNKATANNCHISFDVDVLDPKYFTSTGYNIPNGLNPSDVKVILSDLTNHFNPTLFECVEYNPTLDNNNDKEIVVDIINHFVNNCL